MALRRLGVWVLWLSALCTADSLAQGSADLIRDIGEGRALLRQNEERLAELQQQLSSLNAEEQRLLRELQLQNQQEAALSGQLAQLGAEEQELAGRIEDIRGQIAGAQQALDQEVARAQQWLPLLYQRRHARYLELMVRADSPHDFLVRSAQLRLIAQYDLALLENLRGLVAGLQNQQAQLEAQIALLAANRRETQQRDQERQAVRQRRQADLARLRSTRRGILVQEQELTAATANVQQRIAQRQEQLQTTLSQEELAQRQQQQRRQQQQQQQSGGRPYLFPIAGPVYTIGRRFGEPVAQGSRQGSPGMLIYAPENTVVRAAAGGEVVTSGFLPGGGALALGLVVLVQNDDGNFTLYAQLATRFVDQGQRVTRGQPLGTVGRTGFASDQPLLNFQVWSAEQAPLDPANWIPLS